MIKNTIDSISFPKEWKPYKLGQIGTIFKGKGVSKSEILDAGLPCIRYGEIYTIYNYHFQTTKSFISEKSAAESQEIQYGDILFASSGETLVDIGKAVSYLGKKKAFAGGDIILFRPNEPESGLFLGYLLNSEYVNRQKFQEGQGHSVVHLYGRSVEKLKIKLPSLPEQQKIAQILYKWDELIEKQTQLIEAKEKRKKGLMQKLILGEERFNEFQKTVNYKKIKEVGTVVSGGTPNTNIEEYWNGDIHWCTPTEITALKGKMFIKNTNRKITSKGLTESSANLLPINSLIVCTRATIGDCAINYVPMSTNQGFKCIIPKSDVLIEYIYYVIQVLKPSLIELASGSTFLELSKSDFENIKIRVPEIEEQKKISSILISLDQEIEILKTEFEAFKFQKTGLMQQLLTGKIRVKL